MNCMPLAAPASEAGDVPYCTVDVCVTLAVTHMTLMALAFQGMMCTCVAVARRALRFEARTCRTRAPAKKHTQNSYRRNKRNRRRH